MDENIRPCEGRSLSIGKKGTKGKEPKDSGLRNQRVENVLLSETISKMGKNPNDLLINLLLLLLIHIVRGNSRGQISGGIGGRRSKLDMECPLDPLAFTHLVTTIVKCNQCIKNSLYVQRLWLLPSVGL